MEDILLTPMTVVAHAIRDSSYIPATLRYYSMIFLTPLPFVKSSPSFI
jgi:hypothetical protein